MRVPPRPRCPLPFLYLPFLVSLLMGACALLALEGSTVVHAGDGPPPPASAPRRPNVVLIVADDLGWGETGMQGGKDIPTPHIDAIAAGGVRFTQGYVTCPVCAPTRAALLSGRYGERFGFEHNPGPENRASAEFGLPRTEPTLAERLKALGYATGMFGKWHLGYAAGLTPPDRGFDAFYGFLGGAHPYLPGARKQAAPILRGATPVEAPPYLTEAFASEAAAFIEANRERPFFVYLPFNAVHAPLQATDPLVARFASIVDPKRRTFAAMLSALDDGVGRVLEALHRLGLEDDTLLVFVSDNGGPTPQTSSSNGILRGTKGQVFEGGVRVPFAMRWKGGGVPVGGTYDRPVSTLDLVPTILGAAGATVGPEARLDGVGLLPYLSGEVATRPHPALYWKFGAQRAVRVGDWKLVERAGEPPALFDLANDPAEANDLSHAQPERIVPLQTLWAVWDQGNQPAAWGRRR